MNVQNKMKVVIAEFDSTAELMRAAEKIREAGYTKFDCHSPFPIHGMDSAMGLKRSGLGYIVGFFAFTGLTAAIILQWWASVVAYPLVISGKPFFSYQAYLPVTFSLAVLFAAAAAIFGMLVLNKLPRLNHPVFSSELFKKATDDGFLVTIESDDPKFDESEVKKYLLSLGAKRIEVAG